MAVLQHYLQNQKKKLPLLEQRLRQLWRRQVFSFMRSEPEVSIGHRHFILLGVLAGNLHDSKGNIPHRGELQPPVLPHTVPSRCSTLEANGGSRIGLRAGHVISAQLATSILSLNRVPM